MVKRRSKNAGRVRKDFVLRFLAVSVLFVLCSLALKEFLRLHGDYGIFYYRLEWILCSRYLDEGRFYSSGTPYCVQPPLVYYLVWSLIKVLGLPNLDWAVFLLNILANAATYLLLEAVLKREGVKCSPYLLGVLYVFLVLANTLFYFETVLSTFFLAAGFFMLNYSGGGSRRFFSGILLSMSVLSKILALPLVVIIVLYHLAVASKFKGGSVVLPATMALVFACFYVAYPNIVQYTFTAHATVPKYTLAELVYHLTPFTPYFTKQHILFYVLTVYLAYLVFRTRGIVEFLALSYSPFLVRHIYTGTLLFSITSFYYNVPFYVFIIVALLRERGRVKAGSFRDYLNVAVLVLVLCYGSELYRLYPLSDSPLAQGMVELQYGFRLLPMDSGTILTGYDNKPYFEELFSRLGVSLDDYDMEYYMETKPTYQVDSIVAERLEFTGVAENVTYAGDEKVLAGEAVVFKDRADHNEPILRKMLAEEYSMIIFSPPDFLALPTAVKELNVVGYRCSLLLPNAAYPTQAGMHHSRVLFRDNRMCEETKLKVADYYVKNFKDVCSKSRYAATLLKNLVLPFNGVSIKADLDECNSEDDYFNQGVAYRPKAAELVRLAAVIAVILAAYRMRIKR